MYSDEQPTCDSCKQYNFACRCCNCLNCKHWNGENYLGKCLNNLSGNYNLHMLFDGTCSKYKYQFKKKGK